MYYRTLKSYYTTDRRPTFLGLPQSFPSHAFSGRYASVTSGLSPCLKPCGGNANSLQAVTIVTKWTSTHCQHPPMCQTAKLPKKTTWMSLQFPFCIQPQWSLGSYCILTSGKPQPISRVFRRKWFHPLCAPLPSVQNPAHSKDRSRNSESLQHHEKRSSQSWQNSRDTNGFWRTALTYCINKQLQHTKFNIKVVGWGWYQKSHHHVTAWRKELILFPFKQRSSSPSIPFQQVVQVHSQLSVNQSQRSKVLQYNTIQSNTAFYSPRHLKSDVHESLLYPFYPF